MNSQLVTEYSPTVFLLYIGALPSNGEFREKGAVLLMHDSSIDVGLHTLLMFADHQAKAISVPSYTRHIFQSLGVSLFGNFEKKMNCKLPLEGNETMVDFIERIFRMMKRTLVEDTLRNTFLHNGFQSDIQTSQYVLRFNDDLLRQSPRFTSLWQ
jgi:hypothetical protein